MSAKKPLFSTYVEPLEDKPLDGQEAEPKKEYNDDLEQKEQYDDDFDDYDPDDYNTSSKNSSGSSKKKGKKKMTAQQFKDVDLESLFFSDDDNFDIARKICEFYDEQFGDKDAV